MPVYDFINRTTSEVVEKIVSISDYDEFLINNPDLTRYYGNQVNPIADPVRLGRKKIDNGFKEVLQKIHERTAGSTMNV